MTLNKLFTESIGYNFGSVQIKSMEFVDDLADLNRDKHSALASNAVLKAIQHEKRLTLSTEMSIAVRRYLVPTSSSKGKGC